MPLVPIPRDLNVPRLAGLCITLMLAALVAPSIIFWSLAAPQKAFHLELLQEFRGWTAELVRRARRLAPDEAGRTACSTARKQARNCRRRHHFNGNDN